jgi:hypothetical protein
MALAADGVLFAAWPLTERLTMSLALGLAPAAIVSSPRRRERRSEIGS